MKILVSLSKPFPLRRVGKWGVCCFDAIQRPQPLWNLPSLQVPFWEQRGTNRVGLSRRGRAAALILCWRERKWAGNQEGYRSILLWKLDFLLGARPQIWYLLSGNWIHCFSKPLFRRHCPLESLVCPLNWLTPNQKMVCTFVISFVFLKIKTVVPDSFLRGGLLYWLFVFLLKWI